MAAEQADSLIDMLNVTAATEIPSEYDDDPKAPPGVLAKEYDERLKAFEAEAAANDKAVQEMNEDKVDELARELWLAHRRVCELYDTEEGIQASMREAFNSERYTRSRKAWFDTARAAIEHLKGGAQ